MPDDFDMQDFLNFLFRVRIFYKRSAPPIYIRGTRPPPTADEIDTESEQEDRADTESDHSIRPVPEREQADRADIESDHQPPPEISVTTVPGGDIVP